MKLTDDLPKWIAWPLRLLLYAMVMFVLYNLALVLVARRAGEQVAQCSGSATQASGPLEHGRMMVACIERQSGFFEALLLRPVTGAVTHMAQPQEYVGVWDSSRPGCNYRIELHADGLFVADPVRCTLSFATFRGAWGVYEDQMIWLSPGRSPWRPDINAMDVVDRDFFLLTEQNGTRTRFTRIGALAGAPPAPESAPETGSASGAAETPALPPVVAETPTAPAVAAVDSAIPPDPAAPHSEGLLVWSDTEVEQARAKVAQEAFAKRMWSELANYLSEAGRAELLALLARRGCDAETLVVYGNSDSDTAVIVGKECISGGSEYPLVVAVGRHGVRQIDLDPHRFVFGGYGVDGFTDLDRDGRIECWLSGNLCECDGMAAGAPCDCRGTVVVEEL